MNDNHERNEKINQETVKSKRKGHGPIYWLVVVVGVAFIVAASFNIGMKFGKMVEGNGNKPTNDSNEVSNQNDENSNVTSNTDSNINSLLSDEEAMNLGNAQWKYASSATFCGEYKYDDNDKSADGIAITNFDEVNSHFTSDNLIGTEEPKSFKDKETANFVYKNGKYYDPSGCGRGANISYMSTTLKIVDKKENEIKFTAVSTYCSVPVSDSKCTGTTSTKDDDFVIKKENNSWKIARFSLPY